MAPTGAAPGRRLTTTLQLAAAWSLLSAWLPLLLAPDAAWRIAGVVALVSAPGLWIASWQPARQWALVAVLAAARPAAAALLLLASTPAADARLVGWAVAECALLPTFAWLLTALLRAHLRAPDGARPSLPDALPPELRQGRWLVALVRHSGCTFCRETLAALVRHAPAVRARGHRLAVVHMGDAAVGAVLAARYGLDDAAFVSDPDRRIYRALGLPRGTVGQLFGARIWWRGFVAGVLRRHWVGGLDGDGFQLGGAARLDDGRAVVLHRAADAADIGDWPAIVAALPTPTAD